MSKKHLLLALSLLPTALFAQTVFTPQQEKAIEQIVARYLQRQTQSAQTPPALVGSQKAHPLIAYKEQLFHDPKTPTLAHPKDNAVVVEFFDYQCGHCKDMRHVFADLLSKTNHVTVIFKELPIFGDQSTFAARAALAAAKQGKYWELHQAMLVSDGGLPPDHVMFLAQQLGLDMEKLRRDMHDPSVDAELAQNEELAKQLHIEGTPSLFLADKQLQRIEAIPGAVSTHNLIRSINEVIGPDGEIIRE